MWSSRDRRKPARSRAGGVTSALTVDPGPGPACDWDDLVRLWEETDWPEGCRVEIIDGVITVSPPPAGNRNVIAARLQRLLDRAIPEDWYVYRTQGVSIPFRSGIYVPDLLVIPEAVVEKAEGSSVPADDAELVVEITSSLGLSFVDTPSFGAGRKRGSCGAGQGTPVRRQGGPVSTRNRPHSATSRRG
ncbi:Uma2 family endonuclease [Streptomyces verrucosisporus]|uniref:Uma2 family endonuclease n=1 Tax=Streptomyces verrucosisporus TaxID=1695161 RepID=UPI001F12886B|nr:Uma2 family endonuclease [Streptomyces verrucosisporus]